MSGTISPTVVGTPSTTQTATTLLATMGALTGVVTDFNQGSQVRTQAEAFGNVVETEGITVQALALQTLAYGAMSLFGVQPALAAPATGVATFATSFPTSGAPSATQQVAIPVGTLVQTNGGVQFVTTAASTLASGDVSVDVPIQAAVSGTIGNIPPQGINGLPLSSVGYPLFVQNASGTSGGRNAESLSTTLARFSADVAKLGLSSPVAVANSLIGFAATGTSEIIRYAATIEPWLLAGSGAGSGIAGFYVAIDNGTGAASADLINEAFNYLLGNATLDETGFRPAGVPYAVSGVQPVYANVVVSGYLIPGIIPTSQVTAAVSTGINNYFSALGFQVAAQQAQIAARAADAGLGLFQSLSVTLTYSGSATAVSLVSGGPASRVLLNTLTLNIGP